LSAPATAGDRLNLQLDCGNEARFPRWRSRTDADSPRTPDKAEELVAFGAEADELLRIAKKK
jgi:hypothetical protein